MNLGTLIPVPNAPFLAPDGTVSRVWRYFFQTLFFRTGQGTGGDFGPPAPVTLTGSPMTYAPTSNGSLLVSGAGMIRLELRKHTGTWYSTGSWYGAFPMTIGSLARLTYIGSPVVTFLPG